MSSIGLSPLSLSLTFSHSPDSRYIIRRPGARLGVAELIKRRLRSRRRRFTELREARFVTAKRRARRSTCVRARPPRGEETRRYGSKRPPRTEGRERRARFLPKDGIPEFRYLRRYGVYLTIPRMCVDGTRREKSERGRERESERRGETGRTRDERVLISRGSRGDDLTLRVSPDNIDPTRDILNRRCSDARVREPDLGIPVSICDSRNVSLC